MPEPVDELTTLRIDCEDCPVAPGLRFDRLDLQGSVTLREADAAASVWREESGDATEISVSLSDVRVRLLRPRVVELRLPAGVPPEPGVYEIVAEVGHDGGETAQWPPTPRRVTFEE